ncbi:MAG: hypothetical protein Q8904_04020 [Bacteroidota bacterium]|nr:hypothetical protein [Bacteroidota bacterium]
MKIEYKNGATRYFDWEIEKALKNLERGISLATFFKCEAERFEYGAEGYFKMLEKEIEDYESRDWDYLIETNRLHPYEIGEIIEGVKEIKKVIIELQKLNTPPPAHQLQTNLTHEQRRDVIDKPKIYKHNPKNENYIHDYLNEIRTTFDLNKKITFGAVCLALLKNKIFNPTVKFNKLVFLLAEYWNIEPPADKHQNKYKEEMNILISKYEILERKII